MTEIKKYPYRVIHPAMVVVVTTIDNKGIPNACTVAWSMPVSINPPLIAIALQKRHKTTRNIEETGEFVLNIPGKNLLELAEKCGSESGWRVNKFEKYNIKPIPSKFTKPPKIADALGYVECKLYAKYEGGDHYIFVGEILLAEADEKYFTDMWKDEAELLFHYGGSVYGKTIRY
uniref:Flavin reductase family protein n=1 Tax=candidate division WOR-3 bacterium TaxID=2052148 RepID=A0A7V3ZZF0_UNCW3